MRIAAIYDIHANLPALEAILREVETVAPDILVIGGDVSSGPMPRETIERLQSLAPPAHFIRGNADRYQVALYDGAPPDPRVPAAEQAAAEWAARQMERRHRDFLAAFVPAARFSVDGLGEVLFCNATPRSDEELFTVASPEERVRAIFAGVDAQVVVCGHTHMQFDRRVGGVRVVNAGSAGMPYGEPGAYWALLVPDVELRRTLYDLDAAAARIRATGYPMADDFAENNVLRPPGAAEALAVFEPAAKRDTR